MFGRRRGCAAAAVLNENSVQAEAIAIAAGRLSGVRFDWVCVAGLVVICELCMCVARAGNGRGASAAAGSMRYAISVLPISRSNRFERTRHSHLEPVGSLSHHDCGVMSLPSSESPNYCGCVRRIRKFERTIRHYVRLGRRRVADFPCAWHTTSGRRAADTMPPSELQVPNGI